MCPDSKHSYKMWKWRTSQCARTTQQRFMDVQNYTPWTKHIYKMLKSRMFVCATHKSWKCDQNFFINLASGNLPNASELNSEHLRFCTHKSWKFVQNFLCKPWRPRTSEICLNITENSLNFGRRNQDNAPSTFFINHAKRELPKWAWSFWRHKLQKCTHNFLYKACKAKSSTMRLNFTENTFVFGHKNRGIAIRTFL